MRTRLGVVLGTVAAMALAGGCAVDTPAYPSGPAFTTTFSGNVAVGALTSHALTSDRLGIATVTLTWSTSATDLDFFVTPNSCTTSPFNCSNRVFSEQVGTTSEELTFGVSNGEVLKLWVLHFGGATAQAYSINVTIQ